MQYTSPEKLYDAYVFDMDGTIYLGDHLLPGAKRLIEGLRTLGKPVRFLSNNPTKDPHQYLAKLEKLDIPTPVEEIANTVVTTTRWLKANHPDATVFPISEQPLKNALAAADIKMSENPEEIDIVIASYDRTFEYRKLQIAFDAIWYYKRAFLITKPVEGISNVNMKSSQNQGAQNSAAQRALEEALDNCAANLVRALREQ